MTDEDYLNGQILLIDKPLNSFQAVNKLNMRWLTNWDFLKI
jgi:hypothetical protein